jgi:putative protein-disulfide isomerase
MAHGGRVSAVQISYFTDPACPWSWALEPALRKLQTDYASSVEITYVMSGIAREFGDPRALVSESLTAAQKSGMPVDARLWLEGAPRSSYPACMAVKAAAEQGDPGPYLRRLREGFMCRRRKLDTTDALVEEARAVAELDLERFRVDLGSHAILEAFGADLDRAAAVPDGDRVPGEKRPPLPSLEFRGQDGSFQATYAPVGYAPLATAALAVGAEPDRSAPPAVEAALARFGTMATAEIAAVCELPGPRAPAELWRLALEWRVKPERLGSGELWSAA